MRVTTTTIYQPHKLTTPIVYTLITLAALYIKLLLYRRDVQANYLIQTFLFKLLAYMHCNSTEKLYM